jgi:hypothetical protein
MKEKVYCLACEIADRKVEATEQVDGVYLCNHHVRIYRGELRSIIKK